MEGLLLFPPPKPQPELALRRPIPKPNEPLNSEAAVLAPITFKFVLHLQVLSKKNFVKNLLLNNLSDKLVSKHLYHMKDFFAPSTPSKRDGCPNTSTPLTGIDHHRLAPPTPCLLDGIRLGQARLAPHQPPQSMLVLLMRPLGYLSSSYSTVMV